MAKRTKARPTGSKQKAIIQCVEDLKTGDFEKIYGPNQLFGNIIWEIWVHDEEEDEYHTRFVEEKSDGQFEVHESFQDLVVRLEWKHQEMLARLREAESARQREEAELQRQSARELVEAQSKQARESAENASRLLEEQGRVALQAADIANKRIEQLVKLGIIAFGFATAIGIAAYMAMNGASLLAIGAAGILFSFVASACVWLFGKFERYDPKIPGIAKSP